jgi:hypothetical protein
MAGGLPTLRQALGGGQNTGLPTVHELLGSGGGKLPSLRDLLNEPSPTPEPSQHHGGFLHDLAGVGHAVSGGAHWVGQKSELAATDLKNIPGGAIHQTVDVAKDIRDLPKNIVGNLLGASHSSGKNPWHGGGGSAPKLLPRTSRDAKAAVHQAIVTEEHPLRDPFETLLQNAGLVSAGATIPARLAGAARAIDEGASFGDVVKAAAKTPPASVRLLTKNGETVSLHASKNPAVRAMQEIHDQVVQHALNEHPEGRIAGYATKRIGGSLDETARRQAAMRAAPASALDRAALRLTSLTKKLTGEARMNQAALELTSTNTAPEEAAAFHEGQVAKGVNPDRNRVVARLYQAVAKKGLLTRNDNGDVIVDAEKHPDLAKADVALATVQGRGDEILAKYGVRTAEELQQRVDSPGRVRAGAVYEAPTPGKLGKPSQTLLKARSRVDRLQSLYDRADEQVGEGKLTPQQQATVRKSVTPAGVEPNELFAASGHHEVAPSGHIVVDGHVLAPEGLARRERIGAALSVAKDELQRLEHQAANRVEPTGFVGGVNARPGRGFVSYGLEEKHVPSSSAAKSPGPVVGEVRSPITSKTFTGEGIQKGYVPKDITGPAARNLRQIIRFVNTSERRGQAIRFGSPVKQTERDVLARIPGVAHEKISAEVSDILGASKLKVDDVNGLHAALEAFKEDLMPGLKDRFSKEKSLPVGTSAEDAAAHLKLDAPKGYVWVDRNLLGDLAHAPRGPRGVIGRQVDNVNSAVTAATVYFKIGHIGTRVLTNAATNIIQGSAAPLEIRRSNLLWHQLDDAEKVRALAATGEHGFTSMPHEGVSRVSRVAGRGASWWARHVDAPFRFNSLAYEARKAGFDTPKQFRYLLDKLEDPTGLDAAQTAKVEWVGKRANREAIAYDRLSAGEKQYLAGAIWFYPWVRATVNFLGNTITEHPFKAAAAGAMSKQAEQLQQQQLGDLPSYERGLVQLKGGARPLVADFSTFSPFATPADVADLASVGQAASLLNPVYASLAMLAMHQNQYGQHTNNPLGDAASELVSPTPEAQIVNGFLDRHRDQSRRMFPQSQRWSGTLSPILRAVLGPGTPRRINLAAAAAAASRERSGR